MSMTPQDRQYHALYEQGIGDDGRAAVNFAYDKAREIFSDYGLPNASDDRAESLVAALTRYWIEAGGKCNPPREED